MAFRPISDGILSQGKWTLVHFSAYYGDLTFMIKKSDEALPSSSFRRTEMGEKPKPSRQEDYQRWPQQSPSSLKPTFFKSP